jgi:hypothetical protein
MSDASRIRGRSAKVWERDRRRSLSEENLRQIAENLTGYFRVLDQWARLEQVNPEGIDSSNSEDADGKRC